DRCLTQGVKNESFFVRIRVLIWVHRPCGVRVVSREVQHETVESISSELSHGNRDGNYGSACAVDQTRKSHCADKGSTPGRACRPASVHCRLSINGKSFRR